MKIVKIPLAALLAILQDLYDNGADYIDISGEENVLGLELKDMMKIVVKPDYLSQEERDDYDIDEEDDDEEDYEENNEEDYNEDPEQLEIKIDYSKHNMLLPPSKENDGKLSVDDLNDLI